MINILPETCRPSNGFRMKQFVRKYSLEKKSRKSQEKKMPNSLEKNVRKPLERERKKNLSVFGETKRNLAKRNI